MINNNVTEYIGSSERKCFNITDELYRQALEENKKIINFITNLSHDLRTPISVILNTIKLLMLQFQNIELPDKEKQKNIKHFNIIKQNSYRLIRMFNSVLQIYKIESGSEEIKPRNIDIILLIKEICSSATQLLLEHDLTLDFDTNIEKKIIAIDPDKIERILLNLLSNAAKFTAPGGRITIKAYEDTNNFFISVKDTGQGIPQNKLKMIFERFKQVRTSVRNDYYEGLGIGLSVVKFFIELHNGNIVVKSKEGCGSEFICSLPIRIISEHISSDSNHLFECKDSKIIESLNVEFSEIYGLH